MEELTNADLTIADGLQVSTDGAYTVHGSGMFDDLMEAVNKHLDAQFKLGRVQGSDYAKVYTASLQASMSSAVQYLLGKGNQELIAAQILKINAEIDLIAKQEEKLAADIVLANAQTAKTNAEIALVEKQGVKIDAEVRLLDAKAATEAKQIDVLVAQAEMIQEQGKAFQWNADQKYLKTIIDGQAVNANVAGVAITDAPFNQANIESVARETKPYAA